MVNSIMKKGAGFEKDPIVPISTWETFTFLKTSCLGRKKQDVWPENCSWHKRYTYRVLKTIQMKLIFLCVWAERAVLGSTKTALKFKYEI